MASSKGPKRGHDPGVVRDLLTPELRDTFEYIYGRLVAQGRRWGLTFHDAEDLAQDALVRAWARRHRYTPRPKKPLLSWLLKVAHNLFLDRVRTRNVERRVLDKIEGVLGGDCPTNTQHSNVADAEAGKRRQELILELPDDLRTVFWVWVEQQQRRISREEAADQLGRSVDEFEAAKKRVRRAMEIAMEHLGYGPEDLRSPDTQYANLDRTRRRESEKE